MHHRARDLVVQAQLIARVLHIIKIPLYLHILFYFISNTRVNYTLLYIKLRGHFSLWCVLLWIHGWCISIRLLGIESIIVLCCKMRLCMGSRALPRHSDMCSVISALFFLSSFRLTVSRLNNSPWCARTCFSPDFTWLLILHTTRRDDGDWIM